MTGVERAGMAAAVVVALTACSSSSHPRAAGFPSPAPCPDRSINPAKTVQLTAVGGTPDIPVQLHTAFEVVAHGRADIGTPMVTPADAVCLIALSPAAPTRTGIYLAVKPGHITVSATITGLPGGAGHTLYSATFVVR
jgi:hypothetical protein